MMFIRSGHARTSRNRPQIAARGRTPSRRPSRHRTIAAAVAVCMLSALVACTAQPASEQATGTAPKYLYAGTWNNLEAPGLGFAKGVYGWKVTDDGKAEPLGVVAETTASADTLAASPDGRFLYVTEYNGCICTRSWPFPGAEPASVAAYEVNAATGKLTFLNRVDGLGDMAAEIRVDATGKTLALANYYGGNVVTYRLDDDGRIGAAVSNFQHTNGDASVKAHPHGLTFSPDNQTLYVADQGLDRVYSYRLDPATSEIQAAEAPFIETEKKIGPRAVAVHPNNDWVYVITEQGGSVLMFNRAEDGSLSQTQSTSLIPEGSEVKLGAAQVKIGADGKFLYANHRPNENIAAFEIDQSDGHLSLVEFESSSIRAAKPEAEQGPAPVPFSKKTTWDRVETGARAFSWDGDQTDIASANLGENSISLLHRDASTGELDQTGMTLSVPKPSFVLFVEPKS